VAALTAENPEPASLGRASGRDAFWLTLAVLNAALFLWLLPDKILKSDWLDLLSGKIAPWLATSAFVAGYTWWRDEVLAFSRSKFFRVLQIPLLVFLTFMEVPIVKVRAEFSPPDAELQIDGAAAGRMAADWQGNVYQHELWLLPRPHHLELQPPSTWGKVDVNSQSIELSWRDIVHAIAARPVFRWSVVWPVLITDPVCPPDRIIVVRQDNPADPKFNPFDPNYLATWAQRQEIRPVSSTWPYEPPPPGVKAYNAVEIPVPSGDDSDVTVRMPSGTYQFIAIKNGKTQDRKLVTLSNRHPAGEAAFSCS
jgi:hypothetical protein